MENRKQNEQLRRARQQKDWTQKRAAAEIGVSRETYLRWENGLKYPKSSTLELVCKVFGLSAEALGFTEDNLRDFRESTCNRDGFASQDEQVALIRRSFKYRGLRNIRLIYR